MDRKKLITDETIRYLNSTRFQCAESKCRFNGIHFNRANVLECMLKEVTLGLDHLDHWCDRFEEKQTGD